MALDDVGVSVSGVSGDDDWGDAAKVRLVLESFVPGTDVRALAERHGLSWQRLGAWRRQMRAGRLKAPSGEADDVSPGFARVVIDDAPLEAGRDCRLSGGETIGAPVEIAVAGLPGGRSLTVRLGEGLTPAQLVDLVRWLTAPAERGVS